MAALTIVSGKVFATSAILGSKRGMRLNSAGSSNLSGLDHLKREVLSTIKAVLSGVYL
jgi:hypothetical protein